MKVIAEKMKWIKVYQQVNLTRFLTFSVLSQMRMAAWQCQAILEDSRDTSLSSIASTSPCKDDAKMDVETENGKKTSSSELKESAEGKSKKKKKKKTNKPYQS